MQSFTTRPWEERASGGLRIDNDDHWIPRRIAGLPWWIKWGFMGGVGFMSAFLPTVLELNWQKLGVGVGAGLMLIACAGAAWHLINDFRESRDKPRLELRSSYAVIAGLLIIIIGMGWQLYSGYQPSARRPASPTPSLALCTDGPCAPMHLKQGPEYVKEIGLGVGSEQPLILQATSVVTVDRLRVAVDYSEYRSGWMPKTRAFIGEIKEPVKGKIERLQLIYIAAKANGGTNNLWWGDPTQNHAVTASTFNGSPLPAIVVKGRVAIIGSDGEQRYYFILIRGAENIGTYVGIIPQYDLGDWIESWEAD
jgi:hypothetical protein